MIEFVEKEPFSYNDPFIGETLAPVYMRKDGREYFVRNRVVHGKDPDLGWRQYDEKKSDADVEYAKAFLIQNGGRYVKFYGFYDDPLEMLKEMTERGHTFTTPDNLFVDCREKEGRWFLDFHGNRREASAAFQYRIYDPALAEEVIAAVQPLIEKSRREE